MDQYCDYCKKVIERDDPLYTIPIDKTWKWKEGNFCSLKCAVYVNKNQFSIRRPAEDSGQREKWMREKEEKNERYNKNEKR